MKEAPEKIREELAAPSGKPAEEISSDWEKPAPKKTTFHGQGGDCPWNGDDSDPDTFVHKNRADTAENDGIQYHDVTWAAIAHLKYPVAKPLRKNWTADQIAEITPFEGVGQPGIPQAPFFQSGSSYASESAASGTPYRFPRRPRPQPNPAPLQQLIFEFGRSQIT